MARKAKNKVSKAATIRRLEQQVSERYFEGLPVVDAKDNLRVFVTAADIRKAKPQDPEHCVYAEACRRLFGATKIVFLRTKAYVDLPDETGRRFVNRFEIGRDVREKIIHFDQTGEGAEGGFLLSRPAPSQKLDAQREYGRNWRNDTERQSKGQRAQMSGVRVVSATLHGVRDGRGMVQFRKEVPDAGYGT
jgi:hypothetical protein